MEKAIEYFNERITNVSGSGTATILNAKVIGICNEVSDTSVKVDHKIKSVSDTSENKYQILVLKLIIKKNHGTKLSNIAENYFTTSDYNKFRNDTLGWKIKPKILFEKSKIWNLVKILDLNTELKKLGSKSKMKVEQDKIVKLQSQQLNHFFDHNYFGEACSQNIFFDQITLNNLELKEDKCTNYSNS